MILKSPNPVSTLIPMREFCGLNRVSLKDPACVFEYGMLPKFVPMPVPVLVERVTDVISRNPTGVKNASPNLNCSGELASSGAAMGPAFEAVATGVALNVGGAAGAGGRIAVVLATSPIAACEFTGTPEFTGIPSLAFSSLIWRC